MSDELLEHLGEFFVKNGVRAETGMTFEQFIQDYQSGRWKVII